MPLRVVVAVGALAALALSVPAIAHVASSPSHTSDPADTATVVLDTLAVHGVRSRGDVLDAHPGMTSVYEIDPRGLRVRSLADLLDEVVGVRVRRYGGLGALATASVRASEAAQVEVYLDGVPLNSAQFGMTNLADVAVDDLTRIEVYRSHAPIALGAPGLGGAVNLVTARAGGSRTALALGAGSFGTRRARLAQAGEIGGAEYLVSYGRLESDGSFEFLYDPGTSVNTSDDRLLERENADFEEDAILTKVRATVLGVKLDLLDDWLLKAAGNPGFGNRLYHDARTDTRRHMLSLGAEVPRVLSRRLRGRLTLFTTYQRNIYTNPAGEPGLSPYDQTHRARSHGLRASIDVRLPELHQRLALAAEQRWETFVPSDDTPYAPETFERERRSTGLGIEDALALAGGRILLTGAYRHREARDNYFGPLPFGRPPEEREAPHWSTAHGPSVGLVVRPTETLTLKANRTHHERFPTLFEVFGTNGEVRPNPQLVPETGITWDGGVIWRVGSTDRSRRHTVPGLRVEVGAFSSVRDSLILLVQDSATSFKPLNLSSADVAGIEIAFDAVLPLSVPVLPLVDRLRVEGSFTTQDAKQRSYAPFYDGRWIPYASPRELFVRAEIQHHGRLASLAVRHEYRFFDRFYRDRANRPDRKVGPRRLHGFGARAGLFDDQLSLDLDVDNAFDAHVEDVYGFPIPGRTVGLSLAVELAR